MSKSKYINLAILCVILLWGAYARYVDLGWHFTHVDDVGVARNIFNFKFDNQIGLFAVPAATTYSPFQFIITSLVISLDQSYRELLFWGRLPSCIFGILGLVALVWFYRKWQGPDTVKVFLATTLLTCSLGNIILSKQMHNYALGLLALILMMITFIHQVEKQDFSFKRLSLNSALLAVFSTMQYSILFFIPSFYLILFIYGFRCVKNRWILLRNFIGGGILYLIMVFPMWFFFLRKFSHMGTSFWNSGLHGEFKFLFAQGLPLLEKLKYMFSFYLENFFITLRSHTAFLPDQHVLWNPIGIGLLVLFVLGVISFFDTDNTKKRVCGAFFWFSLFTWFTLVFFQKLTFSPTRHTLILLPILVITISEGLSYPFEKMKRWKSTFSSIPQMACHGGLVVMILILFTTHFGVFLKERKDLFVESEIMDVLNHFQVDSIIMAEWTNQVEVMKGIREKYNYTNKDIGPYALISNGPQPYNKIAWISHRTSMSPFAFEIARVRLNKYLAERHKSLPLLKDPHTAYRIIYAKEIQSDVEIGYSKKTKNGTNSFFFYVIERI